MERAYVEADEEKRKDVAGTTGLAKDRKTFRIWLMQPNT
jgi:hypothetical protein